MKKLWLVPIGIILCTLTCFTSNVQSYTHTNTPIELTSISSLSSAGSYQLAAICFLGIGNCDDEAGFGTGNGYEIDSNKQCINEGYKITSCTLPQYLSGQCPYNNKYYAKCETDNIRACADAGYVTSCSSGEVLDEAQSCPYDNSFKKCKCSPCAGYDYTLAQATSTGYVQDGSCVSCAETKYKRKENPCSGHTTCECGGEVGAKTCYTGSVKKFNKCKNCCDNECTLADCPAGSNCRFEACSNKYCASGCALDYTDWCVQPVTDCADLGYIESVSECKAGYLKCPYGDTVFCEN